MSWLQGQYGQGGLGQIANQFLGQQRLPPQAGEGGGNLNPRYQPPPDQRGGYSQAQGAAVGDTGYLGPREFIDTLPPPRRGGYMMDAPSPAPMPPTPYTGNGGVASGAATAGNIAIVPPGLQGRPFPGVSSSTVNQARNAGASMNDMPGIFARSPGEGVDHGMADRAALQHWRQTSPNYRGPINAHAHQAVPNYGAGAGGNGLGTLSPASNPGAAPPAETQPTPSNNTGIGVTQQKKPRNSPYGGQTY